MTGGVGLETRLRSGVARSALALGAFGFAALAAAPAQACFFISNGMIELNNGLMPPCPSGFFNDFTSAQAALNAMSGGGGPTTTPTPPPTATPTVPTTAAPGTPTTVTSDNLFQILGTPLTGPSGFFDELISSGPIYSDYNLGSGVSTDTYKIGVDLGPIRDIRFRGNYARAVRAPNIQELFNVSTFELGDPLEGATPAPQDGDFFRHDYFGTPLPTIGAGRSAAGYDVDFEKQEIDVVLQGVSDNGLRYGARIAIPLEEPAQPSSPPDQLKELTSILQVRNHLDRAAMILYGDEARVAELYRELAASKNFELSPAERAAIRDVLGLVDDPASPTEPRRLDESTEDLENPSSDSSEAGLSGGVVLLGGPPADAGSFAFPHVLEVSGETRGGVPFDFQIFGVDPGGLSGPPAAPGGPPVVQIFTFGEEAQPQGVRYVADFDGAISAAGAACPPPLACHPRKATIAVDGTGGSIGLIQQVSGSAPADSPPPLIVSEFDFTPTGDVQGTRTLFAAPPQPPGLPPIRLPVAQAEGSGPNIQAANDRIDAAFSFTSGLASSLGVTYGSTRGGSGSAGLLGRDDLFLLPRGAGGRVPWINVMDAGVGMDYRLPRDSLASFTLDVFNIFSFDPPAAATPAKIQPDGSAASMLFGESSVGGVGVTSNGVQIAGSLTPDPVVAPAEPKGAVSGSVVGSTPRPLGGGLSSDFEQRASRFFLDAFIADPAGGRGSADAGAPPPPSAPAPAARPGHASGQIRLGSRGGALVASPGPGALRANMIGRGAVPNGPTFRVRIEADPAQSPARRGVTGILGAAAVTLRDNVVTGDFDVDVRRAERLAERACQGAAFDCGGSVRDVAFSFNSPDGPPIVDVAIGLDAEGRPAARGAEPGGLLMVTLSPNGGAGQASAKVFQNAIGGNREVRLVDVGPSVPLPESGSLEDRLVDGIRIALESVAPQAGRVALDRPLSGISISSDATRLPAPRLE